MFSKSRIHEPGAKPDGDTPTAPVAPAGATAAPVPPKPKNPLGDMPSSAPKTKTAPSILSSDLTITGNLRTSGDIQIEGKVEGDIRAHLLTIGETASIKGEVVADDIIVNGHVSGRVRGLKVRLTSTARVDGDIIHKTIAIESGAHFEGSVQRQDDPLGGNAKPKAPNAPAAKSGKPAGTNN